MLEMARTMERQEQERAQTFVQAVIEQVIANPPLVRSACVKKIDLLLD